MSNSTENQMKAPVEPQSTNACDDLLKDLFATFRIDFIQNGLDSMLLALVQTTEFADLSALDREGATYFVLNLKKHFDRANAIHEKLKGGKDGVN